MNKKLILAAAIGSLALAASQTFSADEADNAYREGYGLVLRQEWQAAEDYWTEFLDTWSDSGWRDDAAYWKCYSIEKGNTNSTSHFDCYSQFVTQWTDSPWQDDASQRLAIVGRRLASQGQPEFLRNWLQDFNFDDFDPDFEFDFDFDFDFGDIPGVPNAREMERIVEEAQRVARRGLREARRGREDASRALAEVRREYNRNSNRYRNRNTNNRRNSSADDELLTILAALQDNQRASEILIARLKNSESNPELRSRIVLLLEEIESPAVTTALLEVIANDTEEDVRNNAIRVVIDRDQTDETRIIMIRVATSEEYPVRLRRQVINEMEDWDEAVALEIFTDLLTSESNPQIIAEVADALTDIGSDASIAVLTTNFDRIEIKELRHIIVEEISDHDSPQVLGFLTERALENSDLETAAIAIEAIGNMETSEGVAALEHIYANTENKQLHLAVIHGMGESETRLGVEFLKQVLDTDLDGEIRLACVRALGETDLEEAVPVLLDAYNRAEDDGVLRSEAVDALRDLRDYPQAQDAMFQILEARLNEAGI